MIVCLFRLLLLSAALLTGLAPGVGHGQAGGEPAGYRDAIESALEEMQLGNFVEAREQFGRAHALFPNARTLRGLGISEFELKHYATAVEQLTAALISDTRPLEGQLRRETEALLKRANTYVGELQVRVLPRGASLLIDGTRTVANLDAPIRLEVGDHMLEFRAREHAPERRQLTIHSGQAHRLEVQLSALEVAANGQGSAPTDSSAPRVDDTPVYKRWWLWTLVGVVVVGAAAGTAIALTRSQP
ncbi:MAG TPA: hypothetical protein VMF89_26590, partial [Polyangiales bacterium]|nr:hypothetical protein [Polyangiales bacterium]